MKRRTFIEKTGAAGLMVLINPVNLTHIDKPEISTLEKSFSNPPTSAYAHVYWFWMNGNVTKEGITLDLEAMKRVGVGGVFNFDVGTGIPKGPVQYLSNEWLELKKHAIREAGRLGIEFTMHNCPGWSASGGPWITPELAMQQITWSESFVLGGRQINQLLPQPAKRFNVYQDIAVIAFPSMQGEELLQSAKISTTKGPINKIELSSSEGVIASPVQGSDEAWMQFEFSEPYEARMISFFISMIPVEGVASKPLDFGERTSVVLEASTDGIQFSKVTSINTGLDTELLLGNKYITFDIPVTKAKYFRVSSAGARRYRQVQFSGITRLKNWMEKTNQRGRNITLVEDPSTVHTTNHQIVPKGSVVDVEAILDLSSFMDKEGLLKWNAPNGNWTILRIGFTPNGSLNKAAPDTGIGLECDKFNPAAIQFHFNKMMENILPVMKGLKTKLGVSIDSYEAGGQNWTAGLEQKFHEKWGYSLTK
ncbi:MAG TPA: glycosyl hydrolase, partial [Chitinophagaceae bacterium]|nr:glycosyl hydrolase [Chitinophagaceae bacterium]